MNLIIKLFFIVLISGVPGIGNAANWSQWLGSNGRSMTSEEGLVRSIPAGGLKTLWESPVGLGYTGPAVMGNRVFLMDYVEFSGEITNQAGTLDELTGIERILCLNATTGKLIWEYRYPENYQMSYPGGPRATPAVQGGRVYALGAEGKLHCLDAKSGALIWMRDFKAEYGAPTPQWGHSAHPLVRGDTVYCVAGGDGSVAVAFDAATGGEKWRALSATSQGYCPPSLIKFKEQDQLIIWHPEAIQGLDPATGEVIWMNEELKPTFGVSSQPPRRLGNRLFVTGSGVSGMLQLKHEQDQTVAELLWRGNPRISMTAVCGTPIMTPDAIYGTDSESGALMAVDPKNGSRLWQTAEPVVANPSGRNRHGTAYLIRIGESDTYYMLSETGHLTIAELTPAGYREISRQKVIEPTNRTGNRKVLWSHPAVARQAFFVRNDEKLVAIDLSEANYEAR